MIWSATFFKTYLHQMVLYQHWYLTLPGNSDVAHKPITLSFNFIGQTGFFYLLLQF